MKDKKFAANTTRGVYWVGNTNNSQVSTLLYIRGIWNIDRKILVAFGNLFLYCQATERLKFGCQRYSLFITLSPVYYRDEEDGRGF